MPIATYIGRAHRFVVGEEVFLRGEPREISTELADRLDERADVEIEVGYFDQPDEDEGKVY